MAEIQATPDNTPTLQLFENLTQRIAQLEKEGAALEQRALEAESRTNSLQEQVDAGWTIETQTGNGTVPGPPLVTTERFHVMNHKEKGRKTWVGWEPCNCPKWYERRVTTTYMRHVYCSPNGNKIEGVWVVANVRRGPQYDTGVWA
tara:strand:- start:4465 stop:4902 length:438 start_codon:yes stop_codon:yes gene_type:complete